MNRIMNIVIITFIISTFLVASENSKTKTNVIDKKKIYKQKEEKNFDKAKSTKGNSNSNGLVTKPMKKRPNQNADVQKELQILKKEFDTQKNIINEKYKKDIKKLRMEKREALDRLKSDYKKKRATLKKS